MHAMLAHMQQTTIAGGFPPVRHIHIKRVHQTGSLWRSCLLAAAISDGQICVSSVSAPAKLGPLLRTVSRIPLSESLLPHLDTALRRIKPWDKQHALLLPVVPIAAAKSRNYGLTAREAGGIYWVRISPFSKRYAVARQGLAQRALV